MLRSRFPGIKIIASEVTPRLDDKDSEVKIINDLINTYGRENNDIFIAHHSNLRDRDFLYDAKHIRENCIARFAANIKIAIKKAYGLNSQEMFRMRDTDQRYRNRNGLEDQANRNYYVPNNGGNRSYQNYNSQQSHLNTDRSNIGNHSGQYSNRNNQQQDFDRSSFEKEFKENLLRKIAEALS